MRSSDSNGTYQQSTCAFKILIISGNSSRLFSETYQPVIIDWDFRVSVLVYLWVSILIVLNLKYKYFFSFRSFFKSTRHESIFIIIMRIIKTGTKQLIN